MTPKLVALNVNGRTHHVALEPHITLLRALRELGLHRCEERLRKR